MRSIDTGTETNTVYKKTATAKLSAVKIVRRGWRRMLRNATTNSFGTIRRLSTNRSRRFAKRARLAPIPRLRRLRLNDRDRIQNRGERSVHPYEDQPIDVPQPHP
jgi:hypothetical protein